MSTTPASDIHPDVLDLAQQITDKVNELVDQVETLDGNNWLNLADQIDALNNQLQDLLLPTPETTKETVKETTSKTK